MNDGHLEDAALKGHFHTLVRHQRPIRLDYCIYRNVDRWADKSWEETMRQAIGSLACGRTASQQSNEPLKIKLAGKNTDECVALMEDWATDPAVMDYWTPATSLSETIDAVAKWKFPGMQERFCFLQLTKETNHKCDPDNLWKLAQPFMAKQLPVLHCTSVWQGLKIRLQGDS